jgi:basic membrane protein A
MYCSMPGSWLARSVQSLVAREPAEFDVGGDAVGLQTLDLQSSRSVHGYRAAADWNAMPSFRLGPVLAASSLLFSACTVGSSRTNDDSSGTNPDDPLALSATDCLAADVVCAGLVLAPGNGVTTAGVSGFNKAVEMIDERPGFESRSKVIETADLASYETAINGLANEGYDVVIADRADNGSVDAVLVTVARANPGTRFVLTGASGSSLPVNVSRVVFDEQQATFLAGAAAGLLTDSDVVAAVLATDIDPSMAAIKSGWEEGARFTNPEVRFETIYHPGPVELAFDDPRWSVEATRNALDNGADVVLGAGGLTGRAALAEAARVDDVWCIGAGADAWETVTEAQSCIATSAVLNIDAVIGQVIISVAEGRTIETDIEGPVLLAPFRHEEIPGVVIDQIDEIVAGVADGSILTGPLVD